MPFVALGLGRFAYGLLLQPMRSDLGWTYTDAGLLTTSNSIGYLIGAFAASKAIRRVGAVRAVRIGLWGMAASLLVNGLTGAFVPMLAIRLATGVFGAVAFVAGGVLAARLSATDVRWTLVAYPAGAAAAIAVTAIVIPQIVVADSQWPLGWFFMAGLAVVCALSFGTLLGRLRDSERGTESVAKTPARLPRPELAYGLFGLGYIAYVTFAVAYLEDGGATPTNVTAFWLVLGIAAMAATILWRRMESVGRDRSVLATTIGGCTLGVTVLIIGRTLPFAMASALFFGASFLATVTAVTTLARDRLPESAWAAAIGRLTVVFGFGQILGPVIAGLFGDSRSGLRAGLAFSAITLAAGTLVALSIRPLPPNASNA